VEALKHAFALRMNLGDPDFVDVEGVVGDMLDAGFTGELREALYADAHTQADAAVYGGRWNQLHQLVEDHGTSHFSIVDGDMNAVAVTTTVNTYFGSKVVSGEWGIVLNNEMDDFSTPGQANAYGLAPSAANFIRPGKRPLSSMSPTVVLRGGELRAVAGASGGPRIISAVIQVLARLLLLGQAPLDAVHSPRFHHQLVPDIAHYERPGLVPGFEALEGPVSGAAAVEGLRRRGHDARNWTTYAVCQLVAVDQETGTMHAVSDRRKGGAPAVLA